MPHKLLVMGVAGCGKFWQVALDGEGHTHPRRWNGFVKGRWGRLGRAWHPELKGRRDCAAPRTPILSVGAVWPGP